MTEKKEDGLKSLIDHLPVVVFEYTFFPDGHSDFTYLSPRCESLLGVTSEVLMRGHLSLENFIHPDDLPSFNQNVEKSIKDLSEWKWEGRSKGKDGYIWLETQGIPVKMSDGRTVYSGIFFDITDKKHLELQQQETEQRYRDLVEQIPMGIVVHSNGKLKFVNKAAARLAGADNPQDLIGMPALQFAHEDSLQSVKDRIQKILKGEPTPFVEEKFVRLDGKIVYVESSGQPYTYQGEPAVQVIFKDITDQKKTEARFRKTETLLDQLFQNTPLAITLLNEEGKVFQINKGFEEMFGFTIDELEGKSLNQFIVPNDLKEEGNDLNNLISSNRVVRTETLRYQKDKKLLSVIIYGVPVLLQDQTIGIFGMYVDITDRKKVEEELKIRNTELDNFVYKVSHDLRAPLSSVLGLAHLASLPGNDDDLKEYIKLMGQKAEQLDHFISDVLSHSKNLKMELKVEKVDFAKIIDQTFQGLSYLMGQGKVQKQVDLTVDDFQSDPWRIAEIFRNLVSNAVKYRRLDVEELCIGIAITREGSQVMIVFKDNGIGIDSANLEKIFEMFYRASDQSEGSGLGLYIVKNAVDKLSGKITVDSQVGAGTTFKILLPDNRHQK